MKAWMQTYTGRRFYPLEPNPRDVCIEDIAHHLANVCRYGGASRVFYSVAEHSVLVSECVDSSAALYGLLHDASEAYIGDMIRPIKYTSEMRVFAQIEARAMVAIYQGLGVPPATAAIGALVREADDRIIIDEALALLPNPAIYGTAAPLGVAVEGWPPAWAERNFLARYRELRSALP